MNVLALDASTKAIGWALFCLDRSHPEDLLDYGLVKLPGELWDRLGAGREWLDELLLDPPFWAVRFVAIETPVIYMVKEYGGPFKPRNAQSVIKQAYAVGILGAVALSHGNELLELRPDQRLTALGLAHNTSNPKPQVVNLVNQIYTLDLNRNRDHDIADAIAIGWAARRALIQEGKLDG